MAPDPAGVVTALQSEARTRLTESTPGLSERMVADDETWAHVAPVGRQIFVRSLVSLIALEWADDETQSSGI